MQTILTCAIRSFSNFRFYLIGLSFLFICLVKKIFLSKNVIEEKCLHASSYTSLFCMNGIYTQTILHILFSIYKTGQNHSKFHAQPKKEKRKEKKKKMRNEEEQVKIYENYAVYTIKFSGNVWLRDACTIGYMMLLYTDIESKQPKWQISIYVYNLIVNCGIIDIFNHTHIFSLLHRDDIFSISIHSDCFFFFFFFLRPFLFCTGFSAENAHFSFSYSNFIRSHLFIVVKFAKRNAKKK